MKQWLFAVRGLLLTVVFTPFKDGKAPDLPPGYSFDITDALDVHRLQDYQAIISQGEVADRTAEVLGTSEGGIILLRKIIMDGVRTVQEEREPKDVWHDAKMDKLLEFGAVVTDSHMTNVLEKASESSSVQGHRPRNLCGDRGLIQDSLPACRTTPSSLR